MPADPDPRRPFRLSFLGWLWLCLSRFLNAARRLPASHRRRIRASRRLLAKLASFPDRGSIIAYLRKIDPLVFEELTLSLFEARGHFVWRSPRYSGDGGSDGSARLPGLGLCPLQCKRYGASIKPAHAQAFAELCSRRQSPGIFIHTGRTGELSEEALSLPDLLILSGSDLAASIQGADPFALMRARKQRASRRRSG